MDEFDLIRTWFAPYATELGADALRDDVAEIALAEIMQTGSRLIVTQDAIVEGVHFLPDDPISTVAQKLVRVNVSDIIAKGGRPYGALLSLVWPKGRAMAEIGDFARALGADLQRYGASLLGGDTTSTDGPLTLSLTMLGRTGARGPVRRSGAHAGDDLWVSGAIGDSWLGLQAATGRLGKLIAEARNQLVSNYRIPSPPPLKLAELVAQYATASIDVSDGLVADAGHIARESGVELIVDAVAVPLSAVGRHYVENGKAELRAMLTGGDDYQTLFTAPAAARAAIEGFGSVTRIGRAGAGSGVKVLDAAGAEMTFERGGWTHMG